MAKIEFLKGTGNLNDYDPKAVFGPGLFWDAGEIDFTGHSNYIIARILDYGDEKDLKKLRELYSDEELINVVKKRRGLHPMTRRYWSVYFNLVQQDSNNA
jgi:hypothetical protein